MGRLALLDRVKSEQRLYSLPPKSGFIAIEALEHAAVEVGETQEAVGQLAGRAGKITGR
jgi:hypothetical protein